MDAFDIEHDLSPFVMAELAKITLDSDFNKNSYDIYSNIVNSIYDETTDIAQILSDNQNSHQILAIDQKSDFLSNASKGKFILEYVIFANIYPAWS